MEGVGKVKIKVEVVEGFPPTAPDCSSWASKAASRRFLTVSSAVVGGRIGVGVA